MENNKRSLIMEKSDELREIIKVLKEEAPDYCPDLLRSIVKVEIK